MGLAAIAQPLSGVLMTQSWSGSEINGVPIYSLKDFQFCFLILPIGFIIAGLAAMQISEPQAKQVIPTN